MLTRVIDAAGDAELDEIVVVIAGADDTGSDAWLRLPSEARAAVGALGDEHRVRVVQNPDAPSGQASSLRVGLHAMRPEAEAAVILLADQPTVRADAIRAVVAAFRSTPSPVLQASYGGRPGHPTLLARSIWPDLDALTGDVGAREAIASHPRWVTAVEVGGDPPPDVDTPDDYARILTQYRPSSRT
jgi:molybdenum cofactor cytidylyltransferase